MEFMQRVNHTSVPKGSVAIFWLGQAGFLLKTHELHTIMIDPYFSEYVQRVFPEMGQGFKRLMPPPCRAEEVNADVLLISHEHADHFDVDSFALLMDNGKTQVYTSRNVSAQMETLGLNVARVTTVCKSDSVQILPECKLRAIDCDHGDLSPDALGFLLDFGFETIYFAGDTALTPARLKDALQAQPDIALLPINGAFGNLNGVLAARYAAMLNCKVLIPCHFWTFPLHHGDPQELIEAMDKEAPGVALHLLCQGEGYVG
ncbi:MAG: MBL fold metallo-hydrolase [Eubacteriales bacterium]|nr:MBL fold metallo-hydrolase [Eubacteriales bacterium]